VAHDPARRDAEALQALLSKRADDVTAEVLAAGGEVSAERLDALRRLSRLVEMRAAAAAPSRNRWLIPAVALGTLAVVSVLLFARRSTTEVEMELNVSEFSFVSPAPQAITDQMHISKLDVSGLRAIHLPVGSPGAEAARRASAIYLTAKQTGSDTGSVSIDPITVAIGARVFLQEAKGHRQYRLIVRGGTSGVGISVRGPVQFSVPPAPSLVTDFSFPRRLTLEPDTNQLSLVFTGAQTTTAWHALRSPLSAESLRFSRIDRIQAAEQTLVTEVPTIRSGTVYFESTDGHARRLRAGEGLQLEWSRGEIRQFRFGDDGIELTFHGEVRGMTTGSGDVKRSLMPTLLEFLRAQHGLSLLWVTTASVVGLFITVLNWWRRPA
jgi:hypothetical protein